MKKINDFEKLLAAIYNHSNHISGYNDAQTLYQKVYPLYEHLLSPPDRPDGYAFVDGILLILEHFEIDATQTNRHGSAGHRIHNQTEKQIETKLTSSDKAFVAEKETRTGELYVQSAAHAFEKHAKKINDYIETVKKLIDEKQLKETIVGFVIEDSSKLGLVAEFEQNGKLTSASVDILKSNEFLDLFEKTPDLDFILFTTRTDETPGRQVFLSKSAIHEARKEAISMTQANIINLQIMTFSSTCKINS